MTFAAAGNQRRLLQLGALAEAIGQVGAVAGRTVGEAIGQVAVGVVGGRTVGEAIGRQGVVGGRTSTALGENGGSRQAGAQAGGTPGTPSAESGLVPPVESRVDSAKGKAWDHVVLQPAARGGHGDSTSTPVSFQVKQDVRVPESEGVTMATVALDDKPAIAFDTQGGQLSVQGAKLGAGFPDEVVIFTDVVWAIGEKRIQTLVRDLTLLKVLNEELLVCSPSVALAEAVHIVSVGARNGTGRRLLMQGALDCGTPRSNRFCIIGQPPPNWSAGERAVLVAAHWTPQFAFGATMMVCAPIGPLSHMLTTDNHEMGVAQSSSLLSAAPSPGMGVINGTQPSYKILAPLCGVAIALGISMIAARVLYLRKHRRSKSIPEA